MKATKYYSAAAFGVGDPGSRGGGDVGRQATAADDVLWRREGEGSWKGMVSDGLLWVHAVDSFHASPSERLLEQAQHAGGGVPSQ